MSLALFILARTSWWKLFHIPVIEMTLTGSMRLALLGGVLHFQTCPVCRGSVSVQRCGYCTWGQEGGILRFACIVSGLTVVFLHFYHVRTYNSMNSNGVDFVQNYLSGLSYRLSEANINMSHSLGCVIIIHWLLDYSQGSKPLTRFFKSLHLPISCLSLFGSL